MKRKKYSPVFLILGMAFLVVSISTEQTAFSWLAITFIMLSLVAGGRWLRPKM